MITDVEISRAVNALSTTLRDQRPSAFDAARVQAIVDGALAGERKLVVREEAGGGALLGLDGRRLGTIERTAGSWRVTRDAPATGSSWALPQPEGR